MTTPEASPFHLSSAVGFQFVRQYYTVLNKDPSKLHCFYKKPSLFTHGEEGASSEPACGQLEINKQITGLNFQSCKVVVSQLDTQPSLNDSVLVMVVGEMSNNGGPHRRFSQTFFLVAEEPGRYYVLNDIFRFLKDGAAAPAPATSAPQAEVAAPAPIPAPQAEVAAPAPAPVEQPAPVEAAAPASSGAEEAAPAVSPLEVAAPVKQEVPVQPEEPKPAEPTPTPKAEVQPAAAPAAAPAASQPAQSKPRPQGKGQPPKERAPKASQEKATPAATAAAPVVPAPQPTTWASRAAQHSQQWGANAANVKGITVESAPEAPVKAEKAERTEKADRHHEKGERAERGERHHEKGERSERPERAERGERHERGEKKPFDSEKDASVFLKNVSEDLKDELHAVFSKFGAVHNISFLKPSNGFASDSAFVDFTDPAHAEQAIQASPLTLSNGTQVRAERRNRPRGQPRRGGNQQAAGGAPRRFDEERPPRRENFNNNGGERKQFRPKQQ